MSEGKQFVRYFPSRGGPIVLNLTRMRLEIIAGEIRTHGMVRTFQNGETPLYDDAALTLGEASRRFIQTLVGVPFARKNRAAARRAG